MMFDPAELSAAVEPQDVEVPDFRNNDTRIVHRAGDGTFKAHLASRTPAASSLSGQITTADLEAIRLSVSDADLQAALDRVGAQRLCLTPQGEDKLHVRIGYNVAGRNVLAVQFSCWDCQNFWPQQRAFELVLVPDVIQDSAGIPPEFVRMLEPRLLLAFEVLAWE